MEDKKFTRTISTSKITYGDFDPQSMTVKPAKEPIIITGEELDKATAAKYIPENAIVLSVEVSKAKYEMTLEEFIKHAKKSDA